MAPKKKTKTGDTLNSRLALVMKSGKVTLGYKSTLKGKILLKHRNIPRRNAESFILMFAPYSPALWQGQAGSDLWQHPSSPQV